ncbi:MAG: hypothetical protein OJF47_002170 [Nitrospira sp.]|nr:MAG: hypothetical protein OJF47_002170 [Nitrospira sp.]
MSAATFEPLKNMLCFGARDLRCRDLKKPLAEMTTLSMRGTRGVGR